MATKLKFNNEKDLIDYFESRTDAAKIEILLRAIGIVEFAEQKKSIYRCIFEAMNFWTIDGRTYILEDYAQEYPAKKQRPMQGIMQELRAVMDDPYRGLKVTSNTNKSRHEIEALVEEAYELGKTAK